MAGSGAGTAKRAPTPASRGVSAASRLSSSGVARSQTTRSNAGSRAPITSVDRLRTALRRWLSSSGGLHPTIQPHHRRRTPGAAAARCRHGARRQRLGDRRATPAARAVGDHRKKVRRPRVVRARSGCRPAAGGCPASRHEPWQRPGRLFVRVLRRGLGCGAEWFTDRCTQVLRL